VGGVLPTCESCLAIDVRNLHCEGLLRPGLEFSWSLRVGDELSGRIDLAAEHDALQLTYAWRPLKRAGWTCGPQRVPVTWTPCHLGGDRPWFRCAGRSVGHECGARAAKLYLAMGSVFACRRCHSLAYQSQSETAVNRAVVKARKLRVRLGGGPSLLGPLPERPPRMHRRTYYRLFAMAIKAQERVLELEIEEIRRRFPGALSEETGVPLLRPQA
jgi:hypothetical protein